jgi:hypothetical protein
MYEVFRPFLASPNDEQANPASPALKKEKENS